jgi:hypothetical protein
VLYYVAAGYKNLGTMTLKVTNMKVAHDRAADG